jgi:adenine-specific DNA methylase
MLKRLIEVALPLKEVSEQSAREKSIRHGHISTLHIWWAASVGSMSGRSLRFLDP